MDNLQYILNDFQKNKYLSSTALGVSKMNLKTIFPKFKNGIKFFAP